MLGGFSQLSASQQALGNLQGLFANALAQRMGTGSPTAQASQAPSTNTMPSDDVPIVPPLMPMTTPSMPSFADDQAPMQTQAAEQPTQANAGNIPGLTTVAPGQ